MNDKTHPTFGPGLLFLLAGIAFLAAGLIGKIPSLWAPAPAFIALGIVMMARTRRKPQ
jgi:hypothetical protein